MGHSRAQAPFKDRKGMVKSHVPAPPVWFVDSSICKRLAKTMPGNRVVEPCMRCAEEMASKKKVPANYAETVHATVKALSHN